MPPPIDQSMTLKADAAFRRVAAKVVLIARQTGTPVIVWDHQLGQIRALSPDEASEQLTRALSPTIDRKGEHDHLATE